jgi:hypothetical protein
VGTKAKPTRRKAINVKATPNTSGAYLGLGFLLGSETHFLFIEHPPFQIAES